MANSWWLPSAQWYAMTKEQQRLHCISVRAYFLTEQRNMNGAPGTPESDWLAAEYEEDREDEAYEFCKKARDAKDRNDKIHFLVVYQISTTLKLRPANINDETSVPADSEVRRKLGQLLGWEIVNDVFQIPNDVVTVGALTEALKKTTPVVRQRRASSW
jgi:hypothetical protein